jgi:hypothetical protein
VLTNLPHDTLGPFLRAGVPFLLAHPSIMPAQYTSGGYGAMFRSLLRCSDPYLCAPFLGAPSTTA